MTVEIVKGVRWITCESAGNVADFVVRSIESAAERAIRKKGEFSLVLAGGTTPHKVYSQLAESDQSWDRWALYYGDERCLAIDDGERNSQMVVNSGLAEKIARHYPIPAELGAEAGAAAYEPLVEAALPFDMVLLGMGEDGHTASLFPGHAYHVSNLVMPVHNAPKPPPDRISLTPVALQSCEQMIVIVMGRGKAKALGDWRGGKKLPVSEVVGSAPNALVVTDLNI
ncbi:MAG TPA: 6-phosphogluconolactonase [Gammaproteobacteria bacterium]|nr:6-phosphogluconolactonase [Gammaproteobacteria bacterium]